MSCPRGVAAGMKRIGSCNESYDMSHAIVWLFDIDGTLIRSGGAGGLAIASALQECFEVPPEIGDVVFSGRTDRAIAQDLFALHGIDPSDVNTRRLFDAYQGKLPAALEQCDGELLAGAMNWLERIVESGGHLGLLTGNMYATAKIKLQHFGIWDYFAFGGYGDDHMEREKVAGEALAAAADVLGNSVVPSSVWVVGDTPHDVSCGKSHALNVLCVATGCFSQEELSAYQPNITVKSLHDDATLDKILSGQHQQ